MDNPSTLSINLTITLPEGTQIEVGRIAHLERDRYGTKPGDYEGMGLILATQLSHTFTFVISQIERAIAEEERRRRIRWIGARIQSNEAKARDLAELEWLQHHPYPLPPLDAS